MLVFHHVLGEVIPFFSHLFRWKASVLGSFFCMSIRSLLGGMILCAILFAPFADVRAETYVIQPVLPDATPMRFTNENWFTLPHPEVANFSLLADGSMHGSTVTGASFVQYNVPNDLGIRVQRFEIDDHYHFIIEGEVAYTFEEFSAKLAQAYQATQPGA